MSERDMERIIDRLIAEQVTRRRLLRRAGAGALSLSAMAWLAACGGDGNGGGGGGSEEAKAIPKGEISSSLYVANWPLYIDVDEDDENIRPSIEGFKKEVGVKNVKYVEEINDNVEFFGKVRQQYANKDSGGRDIHVVTDWLAARMKRLGYVQKLDKSEMPNVVKNIEPAFAKPDFDPNREWSVPWQSGQVLLIFRKDVIGGEITSINDLFDPKFKGKVTMLTEMRDTVGSVLLGEGIDPEKATKDQALTAIEKVEKASKDGQIRRFTGNDYTKDILQGDSVAILGWSGDAVQLVADEPDIGFKQPDEGFMIFTDAMQVPVGAPHAYTAQKFMDYYYQPEVQAKVAAYVNYVPPVKGARDVLREEDPELAENELIFPDLSNAHNFKTFPPEEEQEIEEAFQAAVGA